MTSMIKRIQERVIKCTTGWYDYVYHPETSVISVFHISGLRSCCTLSVFFEDILRSVSSPNLRLDDFRTSSFIESMQFSGAKNSRVFTKRIFYKERKKNEWAMKSHEWKWHITKCLIVVNAASTYGIRQVGLGAVMSNTPGRKFDII